MSRVVDMAIAVERREQKTWFAMLIFGHVFGSPPHADRVGYGRLWSSLVEKAEVKCITTM